MIHWYTIMHYSNFSLSHIRCSHLTTSTVCVVVALHHRPRNLNLHLPFCSNHEASSSLATTLPTTSTPRSCHLWSVLQPCKCIVVPPPTYRSWWLGKNAIGFHLSEYTEAIKKTLLVETKRRRFCGIWGRFPLSLVHFTLAPYQQKSRKCFLVPTPQIKPIWDSISLCLCLSLSKP